MERCVFGFEDARIIRAYPVAMLEEAGFAGVRTIALLVTSGGYEERPAQLLAAAIVLPKPWLPLHVLRVIQDTVTG